jgi:hypothetical protein
MAMSIDEALNLLNNSKPKSNNAFSIQMNEAINVIGVTMRKYQKIEQILDDCDLEAWEILEKVKEVVVDGNNGV